MNAQVNNTVPQGQVAYLITSLTMGGAQKVLLGLLASEQLASKSTLVISLLKTQGLQQEFEKLGVKILYLELENPAIFFKKLTELKKLIAELQIKVLYSFLNHANLFAILLASSSAKPRPKVIWGLHDTPVKNLYTRWQHRLLFWLGVRLSHLPKKIVLVSERSRQRYLELGYPASKLELIPNGVAVPALHPEQTRLARESVRAELGLAADATIIGSLTRSVPAKDLPMMLAAFAQFTAVEGAHLVLAGEGVDQHNVGLQAQIVDLGLQHRVHTLGIRQDSQRLIRAFDFATLSSRSEALPLFLVEAMALGIPCVATRVGDIPAVVANYGVLVAAGASEDLAAAWTKVLSWTAAEKHSKVQAAWEHIQANFSLEKMQLQHLAVIHAVLAADESSQASLAEQAVS